MSAPDWLLERGGRRTGHAQHTPTLRTSAPEWSRLTVTKRTVDTERINFRPLLSTIPGHRLVARPTAMPVGPRVSEARYEELLRRFGGWLKEESR